MTTAFDIASAALEAIPDWRGATLTPLKGGLTNRTWLARRGSRHAVLKADASVRTLPFTDRVAEGRVQQSAADHGLAGNVLFSSPKVLLTEFLAGEVWQADDFANADKLAALATALRSVNELPLTGRNFDAPAAAEHYASIIAVAGHAKQATEHVAVVRATSLTAELRCCHNDLVADNLLSTPALKILDWEYACDNDPLFDLATVIAHHGLNDEQSDRLLTAWCGGDAESYRVPLQRQIRLYKSLYWLWRASRS